MCGAYEAYLKNIETKGLAEAAGAVNTADPAEDAASHDDSYIPAAYLTTEYKDLNAGWVTRLASEGNISPLPQGTSAYLLVGSNGDAKELREWCSQYSAPRLAHMIRQIYGV